MAIVSYAQNHEDVLLNRVFPESSPGFYVDVGACHPVVHSVTKLFYERGWRGINIEPVHRIFKILNTDRQRDINLNVGISNSEGTSTFRECRTDASLSTFCGARAEELRRLGYEIVEHRIPVTTLARVCEEYAEQTIHFLKIDVESHERQVLEGADWSRHRPRVVLVEATRPTTNIASHDEWEGILLAADYLSAFFDGLNRYYVRAEDRHLIPLLAVPANIFDHYVVHDYHRQIQELRHALEASQEALNVAESRLDEAQTALTGTRRELDHSQVALHGIRARFDIAHAQLESARAELAPFQELGPIAIRVARRLRRISRKSPRLAEIGKRVIRRITG
jgi:FkbM family methyltransferase